MLNVVWTAAVAWVELTDAHGLSARLTRADMPTDRSEVWPVSLGGRLVGTMRRIKRSGAGGVIVGFALDPSVRLVRSNARPKAVTL